MTDELDFIYGDCRSFVDVSITFPVELCWTRLNRRPPTWLLQTVEDRSLVMFVRENSNFWARRHPIRMDCHNVRGLITSEWIGEKPSLLGLLFSIGLAFFNITPRYQPCNTLRRRDSDEIIAVYWATGTMDGSIRNWRGHITVQSNAYEIRLEHVKGPRRFVFYGHRLTVSDENGEVATAVVNHNEPKRGRITLRHNVEGIEAVLAFLFLEARELESHDPD